MTFSRHFKKTSFEDAFILSFLRHCKKPSWNFWSILRKLYIICMTLQEAFILFLRHCKRPLLHFSGIGIWFCKVLRHWKKFSYNILRPPQHFWDIGRRLNNIFKTMQEAFLTLAKHLKNYGKGAWKKFGPTFFIKIGLRTKELMRLCKGSFSKSKWRNFMGWNYFV